MQAAEQMGRLQSSEMTKKKKKNQDLGHLYFLLHTAKGSEVLCKSQPHPTNRPKQLMLLHLKLLRAVTPPGNKL